MEENEKKKFGKSVKGTAEVALLAYVAVKTFQGLSAITVDAVHFRRARKANKAAEAEK